MIRHVVLWRLKSNNGDRFHAIRSALQATYHRHPAHLETRAIVDPLVDEHWIVDYEL
jgi:hypothetical protein